MIKILTKEAIRTRDKVVMLDDLEDLLSDLYDMWDPCGGLSQIRYICKVRDYLIDEAKK